MPIKKAGMGLRYFEPTHRKKIIPLEELDDRAHDKGFADHAAYLEWRRINISQPKAAK